MKVQPSKDIRTTSINLLSGEEKICLQYFCASVHIRLAALLEQLTGKPFECETNYHIDWSPTVTSSNQDSLAD